jgi:hypothetical protein
MQSAKKSWQTSVEESNNSSTENNTKWGIFISSMHLLRNSGNSDVEQVKLVTGIMSTTAACERLGFWKLGFLRKIPNGACSSSPCNLLSRIKA